MNATNFKVGILLTGRAPDEVTAEINDIDKQFEKLLTAGGFEFETYPVLEGTFPDSVFDADGWLVTGSKAGVYEDHPWIAPLEEFVRTAYDNKRPIVGICFGHQLIAQAFGGKVEKFKGGWALGPNEYQLTDRADKFTLQAFHQDQVIEVPEEARVIATNDFCQNAALVYGDYALSWQPHPEFDDEFMTSLLNARSVMLPDELVQTAREKIGSDMSNDVVANQIVDFFQRHKQAQVLDQSA